jgi:hypothetical protein
MSVLNTARNVYDCGYVISHSAWEYAQARWCVSYILFLEETCTLHLLTLVTGYGPEQRAIV